jgi:homoserine kinase
VNAAAVAAGAYGIVISGAGPTLLALVDTNHAKSVETAMANTWTVMGINSIVRSLPLDPQGTSIFPT